METDNKPQTEKLLEKPVFSCAQCSNLLTSPIKFVPTKGNVCGVCSDENEDNVGYRNEPMEELLKEVKLGCRFKEAGCSEALNIFEKRDHEKSCTYQPKKCPIDGTCAWLGNVADFAEHCLSGHDDKVIKSESNDFVFVKPNNETNFIRFLSNEKYAYILKFLDKSETFLLCNIHDSDKAQAFTIEDFPNTKIVPFDSIYETAPFDLKADSDSKQYKIRIELAIDDEVNDYLLRFIECPICKIPMFPPIWQCVAGHSFCNLCHAKMTTCPSCRSSCKPGVRNYFLEKLTEDVKYSCSNLELGCREELKSGEMTAHANICTYKYFKCIFDYCTFNGNVWNLMQHLKTSHNKNIIFGKKLTKVITYSTGLSVMQVFIHLQNIFVLRVRYANSNYQWTVQAIGENKQSYFKVTLYNADKPHLNASKSAECVYGFQALTTTTGLCFSEASRTQFSENKVTTFQFELETI